MYVLYSPQLSLLLGQLTCKRMYEIRGLHELTRGTPEAHVSFLEGTEDRLNPVVCESTDDRTSAKMSQPSSWLIHPLSYTLCLKIAGLPTGRQTCIWHSEESVYHCCQRFCMMNPPGCSDLSRPREDD